MGGWVGGGGQYANVCVGVGEGNWIAFFHRACHMVFISSVHGHSLFHCRLPTHTHIHTSG